MLIRSQNKRFLVNIENIDCIGISDSDVEAEISAFNGEVDTLLGFYSTEEKAMEVLDKIFLLSSGDMLIYQNGRIIVKKQ